MMKKAFLILTFLAALLLAAALAWTQDAQTSASRDEAVIKTALDYSDGAYSGDAARMERAVHPDLNKLVFVRRGPAMGVTATYSTTSGLVEMTRMAVLKIEPEKRRTDVSVLAGTDDVACVRLRTSQWCDYLQMIKDGGEWRIVNVLWAPGLDAPPARKLHPEFDAEKERRAAQAAALDYLEGMLAGDAARLEKGLLPETNQVVYMVSPLNGAAIMNRTRYSGILEPAKAKVALAPESGRAVDVRVLDLMDGMAFAAATMAQGTAYLQLQLLDGAWKVVNVLIRPAENTLKAGPPAKK
jgi:hypothetical protein